jgi:hypothetical protein
MLYLPLILITILRIGAMADLYTFKLSFQSSNGMCSSNLFTRASGLYTYLDPFNQITWVNKDWAAGHSQGHSPTSSIYLRGNHGSDSTIIFELFECLPVVTNDTLKPGEGFGKGTGRFSQNAPAEFQNADIEWELISKA